MKGIKEIPTNFRVYYKSMKDTYTQKKEDAEDILKDLIEQEKELYLDVQSEFQLKGKEYGIDLNKYDEFTKNEYSTGTFLRVAKGFFINKKGVYEVIGSRFNLYNLAKLQKDIYKLQNDITFYNKILSLSLKQYNEILKIYYNKVHEKMIIDGYGYKFDGDIGWICINRCHVVKQKPHIDYQATKKNKERLLAEGKKIYNKEEAAWCAANGLEYDGVDARVYRHPEYVYEIPLLECGIKPAYKQRFTTADRYGRSIRGKSNAELIEECGRDKEKICQLDADIRLKLDMCLEVDKILYTKFIRNENQEPVRIAKTDR